MVSFGIYLVQVNVILAWPVTKIFIVQTWLAGRGIRSGVAVRGFVRRGPPR